MPIKRTWTDEQLRAALPTSTSYLMLLHGLGLSGRGGSHWDVKQRVLELGLDTSHFTSASAGRTRSWTDEDLRSAMRDSSTYMMVLAKLGLDPSSSAYSRVHRRARLLGLDTSQFTRTRNRTKRGTRWSDDQLRTAVVSFKSYAAVLKQLGLVPAGGNYKQVQRRVRELGLDTSHFTGSGWNVGRDKRPSPPTPLDQVLVAGRWTGTHQLKNRLLRAGLKKQACELCGWAETSEDGRVPLELDHVNGDNNDNRLENLRILCPNCHSLQATHRGRNRKSMRLRRA